MSPDLRARAITRNLVTMTPEEQSRLQQGLDAIPVRKVIDNIQYLENKTLPALLNKHGVDSDIYKQFKSILDSLIWAVHAVEFKERLLMELSNERLLNEFLRNQCNFYQKELTRYTTEEDLAWGQTFDAARKAMSKTITNRDNS